MFTMGEIESVMATEGIIRSWVPTMDDAIGIIKQAVRKGVLREGTEIHALHEDGQYLLTLHLADRVWLASEVVRGEQILPGRQIHGADAVVRILSFVYTLTSVMIHNYENAKAGS